MKHIVTALLLAPSMLMAKAASPVNMSAPIEVAAFRLDAEPLDTASNTSGVASTEGAQKNCLALQYDLTAKMEVRLNILTNALYTFVALSEEADADVAKILSCIAQLKNDVQGYWDLGCRASDSKVLELARAVEAFNKARAIDRRRRSSVAQRSPNSNSSE